MPLAERQERYKAIFGALSRNDIETWADRFLNALDRPPEAATGFEEMVAVGLH